MSAYEGDVPCRDAAIRIWNKDWTPARVILAEDLLKAEPGTLTLPVDHPIAQWLIGLEHPTLYATIDRDGTRWSGALSEWTVSRPGNCPECEHCNRAQLETTWREDWVPPATNTVIYPNSLTDTNGSAD